MEPMVRASSRLLTKNLKPVLRRGMRVGLLGGSFNPAHDGHLFISHLAIRRLKLDEVWWLVSPQNPLKPSTDMAPYEKRIKYAHNIVSHPKIKISDAEFQMGTRYTAHTIRLLRLKNPHKQFVWLIGADLLPEMSLWKDWESIFALAPVAIFDRWPYARQLLTSKAAIRYLRARHPDRFAGSLANIKPPAWIYLYGPLNATSATEIRKSAQTTRSINN